MALPVGNLSVLWDESVTGESTTIIAGYKLNHDHDHHDHDENGDADLMMFFLFKQHV